MRASSSRLAAITLGSGVAPTWLAPLAEMLSRACVNGCSVLLEVWRGGAGEGGEQGGCGASWAGPRNGEVVAM